MLSAGIKSFGVPVCVMQQIYALRIDFNCVFSNCFLFSLCSFARCSSKFYHFLIEQQKKRCGPSRRIATISHCSPGLLINSAISNHQVHLRRAIQFDHRNHRALGVNLCQGGSAELNNNNNLFICSLAMNGDGVFVILANRMWLVARVTPCTQSAGWRMWMNWMSSI